MPTQDCSTLLSTTDCPEARERILTWTREILPLHELLEANYEHGQTYITCKVCGAVWAVHDVITRPRAPETVAAEEKEAVEQGTYVEPDDLELEEISEGDNWCSELSTQMARISQGWSLGTRKREQERNKETK